MIDRMIWLEVNSLIYIWVEIFNFIIYLNQITLYCYSIYLLETKKCFIFLINVNVMLMIFN